MKLDSHLEKWASGALGAFCVVLILYLASSFSGVRAGGSRGAPVAASSEGRRNPADAQRSVDEISRDDPDLRLDLLKEIQSRPLLELARNPFEFEAPRPSAVTPGPVTGPPAPPPAPPPLPLKALGYAERAGGVREAYVADDEQIFVVHQGESFGRFRVLNVTPKMIEIKDESSHQTVQLPIPQ